MRAISLHLIHVTEQSRTAEVVVLEFVGLRYAFPQPEFAQRVAAAAQRLGLPDGPDSLLADLADLAAHGTLLRPRSDEGAWLDGAEDRDLIVYWLRKLVFRSAWIDERLRDGLLDVDFDEVRGRFAFSVDGYEVPPSLDGDVPTFAVARKDNHR
jgi:hypothetical protein